MEIPVYVLAGFLESGKTTLMRDTLDDPEFSAGEKTLLIVCEEGVEEYDEEMLKRWNASMVEVESPDDLTKDYFAKLQKKYRPERVMVEYNGTWKMETIQNAEFPSRWVIVQVITTVDASTFDNYMSNMRPIMIEQLTGSDMIIFNRCDKDTKKAAYRRSIKVVNRKAAIYFEAFPGSEDLPEEDFLPFNADADFIELEDDDFGIWYIDAMDNPKKYEGKTVRFKGMVYKADRLGKNYFVPGRFAMTCCADDVAFIGFLCEYPKVSELKLRSWWTVTAKVRVEYTREYKCEGPVLEALELVPAEQPEEKLVYFN